ncbi:MAG: hypothetical protein R3B96_13955 [Pirellulaceae bacterium]
MLEDMIDDTGRLNAQVRGMRVPAEWFTHGVTHTDGRLAVLSEESGIEQRWLVSRRPVQRRVDPLDSRDEPSRVETGLWVFALEAASRVQGPVRQLTAQAGRLEQLTLTFAALLIVGTWLVMLRACARNERAESCSPRSAPSSSTVTGSHDGAR